MAARARSMTWSYIKDGVFYMKENNKLERLRNGLYNKITEKWN